MALWVTGSLSFRHFAFKVDESGSLEAETCKQKRGHMFRFQDQELKMVLRCIHPDAAGIIHV